MLASMQQLRHGSVCLQRTLSLPSVRRAVARGPGSRCNVVHGHRKHHVLVVPSLGKSLSYVAASAGSCVQHPRKLKMPERDSFCTAKMAATYVTA